MHANEIRELTVSEIQQKIGDSHQELFNLRFQRARGQLQKYNRLREVKRLIARLKTILSEKTTG